MYLTKKVVYLDSTLIKYNGRQARRRRRISSAFGGKPFRSSATAAADCLLTYCKEQLLRCVKGMDYCYCYACEVIYRLYGSLSQDFCLKQTRKSYLLYAMLHCLYRNNMLTTKKKDDVLVVILSILRHFMKTAIL